MPHDRRSQRMVTAACRAAGIDQRDRSRATIDRAYEVLRKRGDIA